MKQFKNIFSGIFLLLASAGCLPLSAQINSNQNKYIGEGLRQFDFFYAGERKKHHMYLVQDGQVAWSYINPESRGEISDAVFLNDGHIIFAHQFGVTEIDADNNVIWNFEAPEKTEIHTVQPIGNDLIVYVQNGTTPKMIVRNIRTMEIVRETILEVRPDGSVHGQFRHARLTPQGTYMIAHMNFGRIREYDSDGRIIREIEVPSPWSVTPLDNGNILVTSNSKLVREIAPNGETVWEINFVEHPEYQVTSPQVSYRMKDGNTIISNWFNEWGRTPLDRQNPPLQAIMVNPEKKTVWQLCAWENPDLGPSTIIFPVTDRRSRESFFFGEFNKQ